MIRSVCVVLLLATSATATECVVRQQAARQQIVYQQQAVQQHGQNYGQQQFLKQQFLLHPQVTAPLAGYPQPSAVYPYGATVYSGLSVSQLAGPLDPALALNAAQRAGDNAAKALEQALQLGSDANAARAESERLQLAVEHLQAIRKLAAEPEEKDQPEPQSQPGTRPPPDPTPTATDSLIHDKCAKCHGIETATPAGQLYFDAGHTIDGDTAWRAVDVIHGENVPAAMEAVVSSLSPADIVRLEQELRALRKKD